MGLWVYVSDRRRLRVLRVSTHERDILVYFISLISVYLKT